MLYRVIVAFLGLAAFVTVLLIPTPAGMTPVAQRVAAVAVLMAIWWITEAIPIPATALLPLALYPALGIMSAKDAAVSYGDRNLFLFAGGFFIAMAMQKWNLHERIALHIIKRTGTNSRRLILGFMVATAFLSMWISNTATAMMMMPIGLAVIGEIERTSEAESGPFGTALMLGIAYAASIGGIGTLIGTPPNIVFTTQLSLLYPKAPEISFVQWMFIGLPLVLIFLPLTWFTLTRLAYPISPSVATGRIESIIDERLNSLGPMSRGEKIVLAVASMTAISWISRGLWSRLFPQPDYIDDSTVAIAFAVLLFAIPVDREQNEFALDWTWARRIPWGILLLFGGGLALANGFKDSNLIAWAGDQLRVLSNMPLLGMIVCIALLVTFLTELTSNVATTTILLPILAVTASEVLKVNPLLLMIPATMSASCAFMLPVATPPNAIVFGSGHITVPQMARSGLILNFLGVLLITTLAFVAVPHVFHLLSYRLPDWATAIQLQ